MANEIRAIDLHMHSTVSDGTDTPEELLQRVIDAGIRVFSVTDHDAVKAGRIIQSLRQAGDPVFIPGVEFSCRDEGGKYHILGYGFDPDSAGVQGVVEHGHALRMKKVTGRLERLKSEFGVSFPAQEVERLLALDNPGKPHIGNLMVQYGFAPSKEVAINDFLNHIHFPGDYIRPEEAISGILESNGIPVLAHPFYGSGDELILNDDMKDRLRRLIGFGLRGIEAFYSGFSGKMQSDAVALAEEFDLLITAGSDYHGKNKLVRLGDTGLRDSSIYPAGLERFLERFGAKVG